MPVNNLQQADLDADWSIFDNLTAVTIYPRSGDLDGFPGVIVDALNVAANESERYLYESAGDDAGQIFELQTSIIVRTLDLIGLKPAPDMKVVDWDARVWRIKKATLKAMVSRTQIVMH